MNKQLRRHSGTTLAELAPCLLIIFLFAMFPLMDMLYIAVGFGAGWYLNFLETREVVMRSPNQASAALHDVDTGFLDTGLARFIGLSPGANSDSLSSRCLSDANDPSIVTIQTRIAIKPFISVPFPVDIPGLTAPVKVELNSTRPREKLENDPT